MLAIAAMTGAPSAQAGGGLHSEHDAHDHSASYSTNFGSNCDEIGKFCDNGCQTCQSDNGCGCNPRQWYLGVEATFLAPLYDNGAAQFGLADTFGGTGVLFNSTHDKADELSGAPRITLGYGGKDGIGIQGRYWELDNGVSSFGFAPAITTGVNAGQPLGGSDSFNAYIVDLEATKEFSRGRWSLLGTFGARYAEYDRERTDSVFGVVNGDVFSLSSQQGSAFHGTGLTSSLAGLRPLKNHPCLSLYGSVRGSALFGQAESSVITHSSFSGPLSNAGSTNGAIGFDDETMFITELQAGLQWSRSVRSFNGRMFARAGFEYQFWNTKDQTAIAGSTSGTPGSSEGFALARGAGNDFDLIGFNISTGFAW